MCPELKANLIPFLLDDKIAKKNDRINFVEYFQGFVNAFQNDRCDKDKIILIS